MSAWFFFVIIELDFSLNWLFFFGMAYFIRRRPWKDTYHLPLLLLFQARRHTSARYRAKTGSAILQTKGEEDKTLVMTVAAPAVYCPRIQHLGHGSHFIPPLKMIIIADIYFRSQLRQVFFLSFFLRSPTSSVSLNKRLLTGWRQTTCVFDFCFCFCLVFGKWMLCFSSRFIMVMFVSLSLFVLFSLSNFEFCEWCGYADYNSGSPRAGVNFPD